MSIAPSYNKLLITNGFYEYLKDVFLVKENYDKNMFKIRICKLIDSTQQLTEEKLLYFIINPFVRLIENKGVIYSLVFEGYLFQIFINCNEILEKEAITGLIHNESSEILIPYIDICSVPEIKDVLRQGVELVAKNPKISSLCLMESKIFEPPCKV